MRIVFSSIQWMAFILASSIVAPIAIAATFGMDTVATSGLVQRTIFVLGLSSLLQVYFGHRLPINEGPAGLWWGVFVIYDGLGPALYGSSDDTLRAIEAGIIVSGILFILLSVFGIIERLSKLFTPIVTGVYLILLVAQLSGSFFNGMLGVDYLGEHHVNLKVAGICLFLIVFSFIMSQQGSAIIKQYSVLICLAVGWILFAVFGLAEPIVHSTKDVISFPRLFVFGKPMFDGGMIATAALVTLLLLTNLIASIRVVEQVMKNNYTKVEQTRYRPAGFIAGINQLIAGLFSSVASVPISGAAGFIATTKITSRLPFIIGSAFLIIISFFPSIMSFVSALPAPVGYATIFVIFANLMVPALIEFENVQNKERSRLIIASALFVGIGAMFVSADTFEGIPPILTSILNNGLILGTIVAIVVEQIVIKIGEKERA